MKRKIKECKYIGCIFNDITIIEDTLKRTNQRQRLVVAKCHCNKEFIGNLSSIKKGRCKSCGCSHFKKPGTFHYNYNHNLSDEHRRRLRLKSEKDDFSKGVMIKDGYTCQKCMKVGGVLCAHHLDAWHWYIKGRSDINNGVTLCRTCHSQFHKIYGRKWNTKSQYLQFIGKSYE